MANKLEIVDKEAQVVAYNSDTDLAAKGVIKNHQGATLEDLSYAKIAKCVVAGTPTLADVGDLVDAGDIDLTNPALQRGKILFTKDLKLAVVRKSYGKFDALPNITLGSTPVLASTPVYPANATYNNVPFTKVGDSSVKLNVQVIIASGAISTIKVTGDEDNAIETHDWKHDFVVGDVIQVANAWGGVTGAENATGFSIALAAADINATVVSTIALT